MTHLIISVGCDQYRSPSLSNLCGAEGDAQRIFSHLTDEHYGDCDPSASVLLLSPSRAELDQALSSILSRLKQGDIFTFFFAGHGVVKNNIFYMCQEDTQPHAAAITSFPLTTLLSSIQEAGPAHANIVIDACNSGGVMGDFARALSPDNIGNSGTIGISLLASCTQDQYALETNGAGVFTSALISCIEGKTFVQDATYHLDLVELASKISQSFASSNQNPIFWGLNLTGHRNFCKNPHIAEDSPLRRALAEAKPLNLSLIIKKRLQEIYLNLEDNWKANELRDVLFSATNGQDTSSAAKLSFLSQIITSLRARACGSSDPFREIEVVAAGLSPLLALCIEDEHVQQYVVSECENLARKVMQKVQLETQKASENKYSLLGQTGLGELFFMPLRISKLMGWIGWAIYVLQEEEQEITRAQGFLTLVLDCYVGSLRSLSDTQAPYAFLLGAALHRSSLHCQAEQIIGSMFLDACDAKGAISTTLPAADILKFLIERGDCNVEHKLIANPSTLLFVLTYLGSAFGLDDAFDPGLIDLDYRTINAFIPRSYADFSLERMSDGFNATFHVGHDVWTTSDIRTEIARLAMPLPENLGVALLSAACSLIYPDRVAWHLLPPPAA